MFLLGAMVWYLLTRCSQQPYRTELSRKTRTCFYKDLGAGVTRGSAASPGIGTAALSSALSQRDKGGSDCHDPDLGAPGSQLP